MYVPDCRRLRTVALFLLGVAASISLAASVPAESGPPPSAPSSAAAPAGHLTLLALPAPGSHAYASAPTRLPSEFVGPPDSAAPRSTRRIFVEDTTPPSFEALKTARLQLPFKPHPPTPPASPALRNSFVSVSNRQRAP